MAKESVINRILDERAFAVLRLKRTEHIEPIVEALLRGGIRIIEITLNSRKAEEAIYRISKDFPAVLVGAGTVLGVEAATKAIESGAKFLVSPVTDLDMLAVAHEVDMVTMAGALTPTEAWQAWQSGSDFVKLFPMSGLGPGYLRSMRGPFPQIRFVPTNGVTTENVAEWFQAGAVAVGVGTPLVSDDDIEAEHFSLIESRARKIIENARIAK